MYTFTLYTISDDGVIYAEWEEEYPFEIGHFLWTWSTYHEGGFPLRDMAQDKSKIFVNGEESPDFHQHPSSRWTKVSGRICNQRL